MLWSVCVSRHRIHCVMECHICQRIYVLYHIYGSNSYFSIIPVLDYQLGNTGISFWNCVCACVQVTVLHIAFQDSGGGVFIIRQHCVLAWLVLWAHLLLLFLSFTSSTPSSHAKVLPPPHQGPSHLHPCYVLPSLEYLLHWHLVSGATPAYHCSSPPPPQHLVLIPLSCFIFLQ